MGWIGLWGIFIIGFVAYCMQVSEIKLSLERVMLFAIALAVIIAVLFPGIYNPAMWGLR
jgi:hypothetical protein